MPSRPLFDIKRKIRMDQPGKLVIGLFRFDSGLPFESATFPIFLIRLGCRFLSPPSGFFSLFLYFFVFGIEFDFLFGNAGFDFVEVCVIPPDLHRVLRFELLKLRAQISQIV